MWTFLCITHSGKKVKCTVVGNVLKRLGLLHLRKYNIPIHLSFRANIRGDGPFQVPTTTKRLHWF